MAAALVLAATATMVAPAGPQSYQIISSEFDSERSDVIRQGTTETLQFTVGNGGQVPVYVFFEEGSENIDIEPQQLRVDGTDQRNGTLTLTAPPETGAYRLFLTEHRYLALLPQSHVQALYTIHPWLPIVVIDALIGVPFYLVGVTLVGTGRVRRRSRDGPTTTDRLLARLR
jgi:signal peptidase